MKYVSIAIDGPSGAGKSTLAKKLAEKLAFLYVDTGAIYRTVGLYTRMRGVSPDDGASVAALLPDITVTMKYGEDGLQRMYLNGEDVTDAIRQNEISAYASKVSAIPEVRAFLLEMQRSTAAGNNVIMDGRDIGTVVLPNADVKLFLTATAEDRAHRRFLELLERGEQVEEAQILGDVRERDERDTNRPVAPLKQAEDAVLVDTTGNSLGESFELICRVVNELLAKEESEHE